MNLTIRFKNRDNSILVVAVQEVMSAAGVQDKTISTNQTKVERIIFNKFPTVLLEDLTMHWTLLVKEMVNVESEMLEALLAELQILDLLKEIPTMVNTHGKSLSWRKMAMIMYTCVVVPWLTPSKQLF